MNGLHRKEVRGSTVTTAISAKGCTLIEDTRSVSSLASGGGTSTMSQGSRPRTQWAAVMKPLRCLKANADPRNCQKVVGYRKVGDKAQYLPVASTYVYRRGVPTMYSLCSNITSVRAENIPNRCETFSSWTISRACEISAIMWPHP